MTDHLLIHRDDAIATITLNRPDKRNALSAQLMGDLAGAVAELDADEQVRCMILTGADPAFCAGFDLKNLRGELTQTKSLRREDGAIGRGLLPSHDTPIIGAINGPAITGGLELAMACDFLVASDHARFADTHGLVGVMPGGGMSIRLPELIGIDRARRMSLTGDLIDATTAYQWGLVTEVVPHEDLLSRAATLARTVAQRDPRTMSELRRVYEVIAGLRGDDAWAREREWNRSWMSTHFRDEGFDPEAVIERGSRQA